jgi:hypothetical protein
MNGFDVRAIGWVVAGDACADITRTLVGARRRVPVDVLQSLGTHWQAVLAALREDPRGVGLRTLRPLGYPLSATSEGAVASFVLQMVSRCPQRYSEAVLRGRCVSAAAQALVGLLGGATAAWFTTPERVLCADVAIVMLVMAGCLVLCTIQLWRTYRVVKRLRKRGSCTARSQTSAAGSARYKATRKPATVGSTTREPPS